MRQGKIAVLVTMLLCGVIFGSVASASIHADVFLDVKDDYWAKAEIEFLTDKQIINGYPDVSGSHWAYHEIAMMKQAGFFTPEGSFHPNRNVTRAEMAGSPNSRDDC